MQKSKTVLGKSFVLVVKYPFLICSSGQIPLRSKFQWWMSTPSQPILNDRLQGDAFTFTIIPVNSYHVVGSVPKHGLQANVRVELWETQ